MNRFFLLIAVVGIILGVITSTAQAVDLKELQKEIDEKKAVLLDVREEVEWNKAHLVKAKLMPLSKIATDQNARKAIKPYTGDPNVKIYCHCASGKRSVVASDMFKRVDVKVIPITQSYQELVAAGFKQKKAGDPDYDPRFNIPQ